MQVVIRWGDPVIAGAPPFDPASLTAAAQEKQFGSGRDGHAQFQEENRPDVRRDHAYQESADDRANHNRNAAPNAACWSGLCH